MNKFAEQFLSVVKDYETVIVFRHINPDNDALGSQWATVSFLRLLFPKKTILGAGLHQIVKGIDYPPSDEIADYQFNGALGIICDTANHERVDDQRFNQCSYVIRKIGRAHV